MNSGMFYRVALLTIFGANTFVGAGEMGVVLVSIKPHSSIERTHVCKITKIGAADAADCNDPKCASGGEAVEVGLASKGLRRVCKTIGSSVNRGFDITYAVDGEKVVTWTPNDPEPNLKRIGLTPFQEYSPLNPACARMSFKEASTRSECTQMK